jgi:hypothetical protein
VQNLSIYVRVFIAAVILTITWHLASKQYVAEYVVIENGKSPRTEKAPEQPAGTLPATIPKEWEAIFVLVVGYYFAERPKSAALRAAQTEGKNDATLQLSAMHEAIAQATVAAGLIGLTVHLFLQKLSGQPHYRDAVDGAWIAGVAIAAGFYFKDPETKTPVDDVVAWARAGLAAFMVAATGLMYLYRSIALPRQWIALVILVVTFYFKERK